jgi:hypothetical protein
MPRVQRLWVMLLLLLTLLMFARIALAITGRQFATTTLVVSTVSVPFPTTCRVAGTQTAALIQVTGDSVYMNFVGVATSASHNMAEGTFIEADWPETIQFLRSGSADAVLVITCFQR